MPPSAGPPVYEIYALKYAGPFTSKLAMLPWMEGWDEEIDRNMLDGVYLCPTVHLRRNFEDDTPSVLITDLVAWMESYDKLRVIAPIDLLFPGHDQDLFTKSPLVAEGVTRLA